MRIVEIIMGGLVAVAIVVAIVAPSAQSANVTSAGFKGASGLFGTLLSPVGASNQGGF